MHNGNFTLETSRFPHHWKSTSLGRLSVKAPIRPRQASVAIINRIWPTKVSRFEAGSWFLNTSCWEISPFMTCLNNFLKFIHLNHSISYVLFLCLSCSSCSYLCFLAPDHQLGDRLRLSGTLRAGCGSRHSRLQAGHRRLPRLKRLGYPLNEVVDDFKLTSFIEFSRVWSIRSVPQKAVSLVSLCFCFFSNL